MLNLNPNWTGTWMASQWVRMCIDGSNTTVTELQPLIQHFHGDHLKKITTNWLLVKRNIKTQKLKLESRWQCMSFVSFIFMKLSNFMRGNVNFCALKVNIVMNVYWNCVFFKKLNLQLKLTFFSRYKILLTNIGS